MSPLGEKLKSSFSGEELVRTPRAVDSMRVHLRKQVLTEAERQTVRRYLHRPERLPALPVKAAETEDNFGNAEACRSEFTS